MAKKLMKGCEAIGEAAIAAGATNYFCYPITPQTEVAEYLSKRMPEVNGVFLQGESEVAVGNMLFGAAATGKRVFTSSSSPGISLMSEAISYIACAELPVVLVNIMRSGPGLGGILPSQGDYRQATKGGGHGDYQLLVLAPESVQEVCDLTILAFDLADKYRNPVMVIADGMIGQMMEPVELPEGIRTDLPEKPWAATGAKGRLPTIIKTLYLDPYELEKVNRHLKDKYNQMKAEEVRFELYNCDSEYGLLIAAFGTMARICKTAIDELKEDGIEVGLIRPITCWPFPEQAVFDAAQKAKEILVIEMNMGQMLDDVEKAVKGTRPIEFFSRCGGVVPPPDEIKEVILEHLKK